MDIEVAFVSMIDLIYPTGSVYQSTSSVSPATLFGGTWTQIKDYFLVGAGSNYSVTSTGGEATHTLSVAEMPSHTHWLQGWTHLQWADNSGDGLSRYRIDSDEPSHETNPTGGGTAHNNLPPYYAVYMWRRTA